MTWHMISHNIIDLNDTTHYVIYNGPLIMIYHMMLLLIQWNCIWLKLQNFKLQKCAARFSRISKYSNNIQSSNIYTGLLMFFPRHQKRIFTFKLTIYGKWAHARLYISPPQLHYSFFGCHHLFRAPPRLFFFVLWSTLAAYKIKLRFCSAELQAHQAKPSHIYYNIHNHSHAKSQNSNRFDQVKKWWG